MSQPKSGTRSKAARVRHRPPRRKPERAPEGERVRALLEEVSPRIQELAAEALAKRASHALLVVDPSSELLATDTVADQAEWLALAGTAPMVALMPVASVDEGLAIVQQANPHIEEGRRRLRAAPAEDCVRLVALVGHTVAVTAFPVATVASTAPVIRMTEDDAVPAGAEGYALSPRGALKWLAAADPADFKTERRQQQVRRYQERVRALHAAESIRANPRDLGDVLLEAFDGAALHDAFRTGALEAAFERIFERCAVVS